MKIEARKQDVRAFKRCNCHKQTKQKVDHSLREYNMRTNHQITNSKFQTNPNVQMIEYPNRAECGLALGIWKFEHCLEFDA